ncbi:MAG: methylmalonyl-CoA epimerase [Candidatus Kapabacteria bacterium]|nr:methylmalonyl-CoA epimerase [Candidatus Kapabacteria bacterium]MBX7154469.1 methylmalonyl-CoA epimerase [Bacteroidota bacterium]
MVNGINHIGIAVKNLEESLKTFSGLMPVEHVHRETVEAQKVNVASFIVGNIMIELLEGTSPESAISKFIEKKGEGIHHIALQTDDAAYDLTQAIEHGFAPIDTTPRVGAHNALVGFLHPKSTNSVLIEFCQPRNEEH